MLEIKIFSKLLYLRKLTIVNICKCRNLYFAFRIAMLFMWNSFLTCVVERDLIANFISIGETRTEHHEKQPAV